MGSSATDGSGHMSSANVCKLIDKHLDDAMRHLDNSHRHCLSERTHVPATVSQPYAGITDHIYRISRILSQLTSALTQETIMKDTEEYILAPQSQGGFPMSDDFLNNDIYRKKLQYVYKSFTAVHMLTMGQFPEVYITSLYNTSPVFIRSPHPKALL